MDDMIQLSPRQRDDLRRMVQQAGVDVREVPSRITTKGLIQLYCPTCKAEGLWRSTRAVPTRQEALLLLAEHLHSHHGQHLARPPAPVVEDLAFI